MSIVSPLVILTRTPSHEYDCAIVHNAHTRLLLFWAHSLAEIITLLTYS